MASLLSYILPSSSTPSSLPPSFLPEDSLLPKIATIATGVIAVAGTAFLASKVFSSSKSAMIAHPLNPPSSFWKAAGKILLVLFTLTSLLASSFFLFGPLGLGIAIISLFIIAGILTGNPLWPLAIFFIR